jgi:hypothetical protein
MPNRWRRLGTTIIQSATAGDAYYSPSFPRGGQSALFSIETTHIKGAPTLVVTVEHKNADDVAYTTAGTFADITTKNVFSLNLSGLKEEIRFKFTFGAGGVAGDFFHVLVPAPAWRPY